jgi:hypothetical protein
MNTPPMDPDSETVTIARAVRFGFAAVVLGLSYPNIRFALGLHDFGVVYQDMLGAPQAFPAMTRFVFWAQPFLIALSILIPLAAILAVFVGRLARSIYISGALIVIVFVQLFLTWHAASLPFFEIIRRMQGAPPQ